MKLKDLQAKRAALIKENETLLAKEDRSADDATKVRANLEEVDRLDAEIDLFISAARAAAKGEELVGEGKRLEDVHDIRVGDDLAKKKPWHSLGEFLLAVRSAAVSPGAIDPRLATRAASGASEGVQSDGGFLVGTDYAAGLYKAAVDASPIAGLCNTPIQIGPNSNGLAMNAIDETSRVSGSHWGGVQVYWASEAGTASATKPKFRKMRIDLEKLLGLFYATDELLQDAAAIGSVVQQAFPEVFGWQLGESIYNGNGAGRPLGFMNSGALVTVAKEGSQAADTVNFQNVLKMWNAMPANLRKSAAWLINQDVEVQLAQMSLTVGTGGIPVFLPAGGASVDGYATLFGRPVIPNEHSAAIGDLGDIALVDLKQYLLITKGGIETAESMHVAFLTSEMAYRFTWRINGQPLWNSTLTAAKGSTVRSPFVTLAAR